MATAAVDTARLASFANVPRSSIDTLLHEPTVALVTSFLQALTAVAQEHERLQGDNLRLGIELENSVRNAETKTRGLKSSAEKALQEVDSLRKKLDNEEIVRSGLESKLETLQVSSTASSSEVDGLQTRIKQLEKTNRDTTSLLEAKSVAHDKLKDEITAQHLKAVQVKRDIATIQEKLTAAEDAAGNAKFRESALQQEVAIYKRNNEWLDSELKSKAAEHSKFRKDKNARVAELQRANEDALTNIESLRKTESSLRSRLDDAQNKADEAFTKIQKLQEDAARQEEFARAELESSKRLASLQEQSANSAKLRVKELDATIDTLKHDIGNELSQLQSDLESERDAKSTLEQRVEELEVQIEQLESSAAARPVTSLAAPMTPARGTRSLAATPARAASPAPFTPASVRSRGNLTMTQLYDEYNQVRSALASEKTRNEKLSTIVDEMMHDLEHKGPELEELEGERLHLTKEVERLSTALMKAGADKDAARKDCRKFEGQVNVLNRQAEILRQQARDLGVQIKVLLAEIQNRGDGTELSIEERQQLRQAAEESSDVASEGMTDTGRFISQNLVKFRSVFELQETNAKLLHLTRTLGEQMEGEEARAKQNQQDLNERELEDLRDRVAKYSDELKALGVQSQSYIQERDMFRRMLAHRGQLPPDADPRSMFANSINGTASPAPSHHGETNGEHSATAKQLAEHIKLLRDMQSHFDAYRQEAATDHQTLRSQVDVLAKEKADLQSEMARADSQLSLARERYEMLQTNFTYLKSEGEQAQKRSQALAESAAKQDLRTQQVAEELVEAKGLVESMRNESANLKAEKELWKRIETRLTEDNRSLVEERARLNKAIADNQSLANERQLADSDTRRRLESQTETLESELRGASHKLEEMVEEKKREDLRKEYELEQSRTRIDDLMKSLSNTKEELSGMRTARDQLQARVDELKIDLRNAEERAQALQPRPTARSSAAPTTTVEPDEASLSREQELAVEVADLRRDLELAKSELENAKLQVEDYKAISQRSEEELQSLTETQEQYRAEMDAIVAEKDARIQELHQRVEDITSELSISNTQLSEVRTKAEDAASRLEQQQMTFNEELARVKDESERHFETARFHQADLKAQAEIAQKAQQSYDNELVKHAEAAQALQKVRNEFNETKLEVSRAKADAEAARTMLTQNEESWSAAKDQYEKELEELKERREDVDKQNKVLHQQLENVGAQISSFQQKRTSSEGQTTDNSDSSAQNYQEVIRYLRREKEIVDVQYELSTQEARRLKQQLDYAQSQLDEARIKLDQERRKQADEARSSMSHSKLMDTINELNVFRESSVTLRSEARQAQSQLAEKTKQVEELNAQLEPLRTELRTKQAELETAQGEIVLAKEDRDRWQTRMQNILQKYDRIDPAELEGLKEQINTLTKERDAAAAEQQTLQQRVDGIPSEIQESLDNAKKEFDVRREKLVTQFKERSKDLSGKLNDLRGQLSAAQNDLESAKTARDQALTQIQSLTAQDATQKQNDAKNSAATADLQASLRSAQENMKKEVERANALQQRSESLQQELDTLRSAAQAQPIASAVDTMTGIESSANESSTALQDKLQQEEQRANTLQRRVDELEQEVTRLNYMLQSQNPSEHLEKLKIDLQDAQRELDALRAAALSGDTAQVSGGPTNEVRESLERDYQEKIQAAEAKANERISMMKDRLNGTLAQRQGEFKKEREDAIAKLMEEHNTTVQRLKDEHTGAVSKLKEEHESEMSKLRQAEDGDATSNAAIVGETKAVTQGDTAESVLSEGWVPPESWEPPKEVMRRWLRTVPHVRDLVTQNVNKRVTDKVEEAKQEAALEQDKIKQESAQELEEVKKNLTAQKERAVLLENKKQAAKLSAAESRLRTAQAKVDVVQKAASDTPERPVGEVWAEAKDVKPPPKPVAPTASTTTTGSTTTATEQKPSPATQVPSKPTSAESAAPSTAPSQVPTLTPAPAPSSEPAPSEEAVPETSNGTAVSKPTTGSVTGTVAPRGSSLPRGNAGRGGLPGRGGSIPVPSSAMSTSSDGQRGNSSGIPRGGSVRGRGGAGAASGRGGASARGGLNAGANTFVPGQKRPRDDSTGPGGDATKRQRGGQGGGA